MNLVVEPFNYKHALECIQNNVDFIILGNEVFSNRISYSFNESEICDLVNACKKTRIWIKVNNFFYEHELDRLLMYLRWISTLGIDRVVFQDYAIVELNYQYNLNLNLHYNSETMTTNYKQFPFFQQNKINSVFLARELMFNEVEEIAKNKGKTQIEIFGFGYGFIMHSRWPLLSNYITHYNLKNHLDKNKLIIRENLRKKPNMLYEDKSGTHMFTGYLICVIELLEKLNSINIDFLNISFLKLNYEYASKITNIFSRAISDLNKNKFNGKEYHEEIKQIVKDIDIAKGFLGGPKEILNLEKDDNE